jgi:hypothetical protein
LGLGGDGAAEAAESERFGRERCAVAGRWADGAAGEADEACILEKEIRKYPWF